MIAAFVLVTGVLVVLVIGAAAFAWMGMGNVLASLVPIAPWLVMVGSFLLILTELLLVFGGKEDRRMMARDLAYLLPTFVVSAGLWYVTQLYLW